MRDRFNVQIDEGVRMVGDIRQQMPPKGQMTVATGDRREPVEESWKTIRPGGADGNLLRPVLSGILPAASCLQNETGANDASVQI